MGGPLFSHIIREALTRRNQTGLLRHRHIVTVVDATHVDVAGRRLVNFASNNYLGLTQHPRVIAAAQHAVHATGTGSGASPLICGHTDLHERAERAIAQWKNTEAAILLSSGYQAAHAAVGALAAVASCHCVGMQFLADKLCHASLLDAVAALQLPLRVFPHNHLAKLRRLLEGAPVDQLQVVLTESIFSMDGDAADLDGIARLKSDHGFFLLLDEAHATGVYGDGGAGLAADRKLSHIVDASIVTLSKAMGISGGVVCASAEFCDAIINWGRAYIYSTAVPPVIPAAALAAIEVMRDEPHRQHRVRELSLRVRSRLAEMRVRLPAGDSPIIPIVLRTEAAAMQSAEKLRGCGLLVVAIRPPTVRRGTSRLRVSLSCEHTDDEIDQLLAALRDILVQRTGYP